ncbi:MAG: DUF3035 domain-containing protein [Pseudomonadota bacterium]
MTLRRSFTLVSIVLLTGAVTACEQARQSLGLGKNPPDEFKIVSRAPLVVPETFALPSPSPGKTRPQELQPQEDAQAALFGRPLGTGEQPTYSAGEQSVLVAAQTDDDVEDIRDTIDREYAELYAEENDWVDDVLFWKDEEDPTALLIDPDREADRLQSNAALGVPANEGEFEGVVVEPREKAILEDIF